MKVALETEAERVPLSKSFPAPNYKKLLETGMASWKVEAVKALQVKNYCVKIIKTLKWQ